MALNVAFNLCATSGGDEDGDGVLGGPWLGISEAGANEASSARRELQHEAMTGMPPIPPIFISGSQRQHPNC